MIQPTQEQEDMTIDSLIPLDSPKRNNTDLVEAIRAYFKRHTNSIDIHEIEVEGGLAKNSDALTASLLTVREIGSLVEPLLEGEAPADYVVRVRVPAGWVNKMWKDAEEDESEPDMTKAWKEVISHCTEILSSAHTVRANRLFSPFQIEGPFNQGHEVIAVFAVKMQVVALDEEGKRMF